jgi:hypothetical protein
VGSSNELPAERRGGELAIGPLPPTPSPGPDARLAVVVRPQDVAIGRTAPGWPGRIVAVRVVGPLVHVDVALEGGNRDPVVAEFERERFRRDSFAVGDAVFVNLVRFGLYAPDEAA